MMVHHTNDGPSHIIVPGLYMGADNVDGDNGDLESIDADADDLDGNDDENGVASFNPLTTTTVNYSVTVNVTNTSTTRANLIGWIDFNGNGVFEETEASNVIENITTDSDGNLILNWTDVSTLSSGVSAGTTYARFRLSNDTLTPSSSTGALNSGEVEDYQVTIQAAGQDYGDVANIPNAPGNGYDTANTSHDLVDGLKIGSIIDSETAANTNATATGDNLNGADDEEGVRFTSNLTTTSTSYSVTVDITNTITANAELIGWIDFDGDGVFEEQEASDPLPTITASGEQTLTWSNLDNATRLPDGINLGDTYARFRLNDNTVTNMNTGNATGALDGGEVEDYAITIYNEVNGFTYPESLSGTPNIDSITGLDGQDTLTGGAGDDVFVYTKTSDGIDTITDFEDGADKLDFRGIVQNELDGVTVTNNLVEDGYIRATNFGSAGVMIKVDPDAGGNILAKNVVLLKSSDSNFDAADIGVDDFIF